MYTEVNPDEGWQIGTDGLHSYQSGHAIAFDDEELLDAEQQLLLLAETAQPVSDKLLMLVWRSVSGTMEWYWYSDKPKRPCDVIIRDLLTIIARRWGFTKRKKPTQKQCVRFDRACNKAYRAAARGKRRW